MSLQITIGANRKRSVTNSATADGIHTSDEPNDDGQTPKHLVLGDSMVRGIEIPNTECVPIGGGKILDLLKNLNSYNPSSAYTHKQSQY